MEVTGKISTPFPIQVVISPGNVVAKLIRNHRTDLVLPTTDLFELAYSAQVRLKPGQNVLRIAVIDPLSVTTVEREVYFKPNFDFQELKIYPNPVPRDRYQVTFQTEANQPLDDIRYSIYAVSANDSTTGRGSRHDTSTGGIWVVELQNSLWQRRGYWCLYLPSRCAGR